jgi:hypothetical protein
MPRWAYRFCASSVALTAFLAMSYLYWHGDKELYQTILTAYGIVPFRFPFVDISNPLAAWECVRQGIDVILSDPCDVLQRKHNYSPLWLATPAIPLDVSDTTIVGWILDLLFIMSLSLLPAPRNRRELAVVLAATLSTMVVFAMERANPDVLLFMLALATGLLVEGRLAARLLGYCVALAAALLKYYPIMLLIVVLRERIALSLSVLLAAAVALAIFWIGYHDEIIRGLANIPGGRYDTDLFAAKNLPHLLGAMVATAAEPSALAAPLGNVVEIGLYVVLVGGSIAVLRRLSDLTELPAALTLLSGLERTLLVIGSAVVAGCFFAGQSIGYRGVYLLLVLPGLLAISRSAARELRALGLGTGAVIVLLMWGECLRHAVDQGLEQSGISEPLADALRAQFWLLRELGWWWAVSVMLAVLADFLCRSPILRGAVSLFARVPLRAR